MPYAGADAGVFAPWVPLAAPVGVVATRLPGRGSRLRETPHRSIEAAFADCAEELLDRVDRPTVLYGHSMGALLAYEFAALLQVRRPQWLLGLVVAARPPPKFPPRLPLVGDAPDAVLLAELASRYGQHTPPGLLADPALAKLIVGTVRADVTMAERYAPTSPAPLNVPVLALAGTDDLMAPATDLDEWRELALAGFTSATLPGNHFFLTSHQRETVALIHASFFARK